MSATKETVETVRNGPKTREIPCYFCNEAFEMGRLQNHLKQCGSILEQCPLRCGAWIQRRHKDPHRTECPSLRRGLTSGTHSRPSDPGDAVSANHTWSPRKEALDDCVSYLEKEVANIKLVLTEEANQLEIQSSDLETLRTKQLLHEEKTNYFISTLVSLRTSLDDEADRTSNWAAQFKHDLSNVQLALQELQSQQLSTAMRLESAVSSIVHEQRERELLEQALTNHDSRIRSLSSLEEVIEYIKQALNEERERNANSRSALSAELMKARRNSEQLGQLAALRVQLQGAASERPGIDRVAVLEVATADARVEAEEQRAKVETLSRDLRALTKSYLKVKAELADFQARVSFGSPELGSDDGHLIWRLDNFTARMKEAKDTDAVLSSPLFRTSKYGYTLKAEVHLNGIGKWKGRHITSTVRLVSGPYDSLLQWPCDITINIVLKDQATDRNQAMDIVKSLELRRKSSSKRHDFDDGETSKDSKSKEISRSTETLDKNVIQMKRQYVFIPHTSLDKFDYIKNDVMYLEFVVNH